MSRANQAHVNRRSRARRKWSWRVRHYDYSALEMRTLAALFGGAAGGGKTETQRLHLENLLAHSPAGRVYLSSNPPVDFHKRHLT
jgi:hypothetical protein